MIENRQETIADIVADIRAQNQGLPEDDYALSPLVADLLSFADRIEAAWKRERAAGAEEAKICGEIGEMIGREEVCKQSVTNCNRFCNASKMREALSDACYAMFNFLKTQNGGYEEMAKALDRAKSVLADSPRNCDRISDAVIQSLRDKKLEMAGEIAAKEAEIAELRECLKEAIREKCPFTRMSCKHGEPCDYECGTFKWRNALKGSNNATK